MNLRAPTSPAPLEIRLFGAFELRVHGLARDKVPAAVQALLALLVHNSKSPLSRQALAAILWPNVSDEQSSFYFRRALSQLRALLDSESSRIGPDLAIDLTDCRCDLSDFEALLNQDPLAAIAAYTGPLVVGKRNHRMESVSQELAEKYLGALTEIAETLESDEDYSAAIRVVRQLLNEDRTSERAWRSLIRLLGLQKDHVGAARAFRQLRIMLREETGMEPEAETTALYHQVMAESDVLRVRPTQAAKPAFTNPRLPTPLTSLIGRVEDVEAIRAALMTRRLVFIVGLGGVGKTRLAIEIAETWGPSASVSLARAQDSEDIQSVLKLENLFQDDTEPDKRRLLLLDSTEHLLELLRPAVEGLLTDHPELVILVTSRRSISWPEAHVHHLSPLRLPGEDHSLSELGEVAAIKLFAERARSADSEFRVNSRNATAITSICRKLDGLPMAIELAAAKVQSIPVSEIDRRLEDRFSLLNKRGVGQTLETVIDWSYEGLTESERDLFLDLVQLPGSWSFEACQAVGKDFAIDSIDSLVALDLVIFQGGRYRCLRTVREYGLQRRKASPTLVRRLSEFFFLEVEARFPMLERTMDVGKFDWFIQEEPNLVWVLHRATKSDDIDFVRQALVLFTHLNAFWIRTGRSAIGYRLGMALLDGHTEPSEELTAALFSLSDLAHHSGRLDSAEELTKRGDEMVKVLGLSSWHAESLRRQAEILMGKSQPSEAIVLMLEALQEFEKLGNLGQQATCLRDLGYAERERGKYPEAIELTRRALRIHTELDDPVGRLWCIGSLGSTFLQAGDAEQASPYFLENIESAKAMGDVSTTIWNLVSLATAQSRLGNYEIAEGYVREAIALYGPDPDPLTIGWPTSVLGEILMKRGDYAGADQLLDQAWRIHSQSGKTIVGAYTLLRRAELHHRWGRLESARAFFETAEDLVREFESEDLVVHLEVIRANLAEGTRATS